MRRWRRRFEPEAEDAEMRNKVGTREKRRVDGDEGRKTSQTKGKVSERKGTPAAEKKGEKT